MKKSTLAKVIALIAGLGIVAYFVPAFLRVRASAIEAAYKTTLLTNVKQVAQSIQVYAADFNDRLPQAYNWVDVSEKKSKDLYAFRHVLYGRGYDRDSYEFAFNSALDCLRSSDIDDPSSAILVFQTTNRVRNSADPLRSLAWRGEFSVTARIDCSAKATFKGEIPKSRYNGPVSP